MKVTDNPLDEALARLVKQLHEVERGGASNLVVSAEDLRWALEALERLDEIPFGTV